MWCIRRDCCGVCCAVATAGLMLFAEFVQVKYVIGPWKGYFSWYTALYTLFMLLSFYSHFSCMTTDPGAVPEDWALEEEEKYPPGKDCEVIHCHKCTTPKPREAHHCSTCRRCVIRLDHHCPWVNNCVGFKNQKYFMLFLFYTGVTSLWCLVTLGCRFYVCGFGKRTSFRPRHPMCQPTPADTICCVFNFVEGIMFGLFVTIMLYDQLQVIFDNTTLIHKKKRTVTERKSKYDCISSVFGEDWGVGWLIPKIPTETLEREFMSLCNAFDYKLLQRGRRPAYQAPNSAPSHSHGNKNSHRHGPDCDHHNFSKKDS